MSSDWNALAARDALLLASGRVDAAASAIETIGLWRGVHDHPALAARAFELHRQLRELSSDLGLAFAVFCLENDDSSPLERETDENRQRCIDKVKAWRQKP